MDTHGKWLIWKTGGAPGYSFDQLKKLKHCNDVYQVELSDGTIKYVCEYGRKEDPIVDEIPLEYTRGSNGKQYKIIFKQRGLKSKNTTPLDEWYGEYQP